MLQVAQLNSSLALYTDMGGTVFATPSISEKGYLDVEITLSTLGGHSSVPPSHTVRVDCHTFLLIIDQQHCTEYRSPLPFHSSGGG
jgi:acetylornithine deacetylase/succinyl-diaminopimelate desuccinylase-like protein